MKLKRILSPLFKDVVIDSVKNFNPGKLCDAFTNYLHDKCERLDYLSDYCGPIAIYFPKRIIQKQCTLKSPVTK